MSTNQTCEIFYVKRGKASGWQWRPAGSRSKSGVSAETYALYYECVVAARVRGYSTPRLKCS